MGGAQLPTSTEASIIVITVFIVSLLVGER